jgi:aminoglycoside phosphotransferase (APT) family kinase protein
MTETTRPAPIDEPRVGAWLAEHVPGARPPFSYRLITGGRSNLTFAVADAEGERFVLRRPPVGPILATAHDVAREWRLVAALGPTPVPVPPALAVCEDPSVNGLPFAVTGFVRGIVMSAPEMAASLAEAQRRDLALHMVDVLADLHSVDLEAVGLADLSSHASYIERQLRRWSRQWADSRTQDLPLIDEVERRLRDGVPEQREVTLVHGDYRFGNCIVDAERARVAAVLDWELCTLGDPLADLGHLGVYWRDPALDEPLTDDPTAAGGFPPYRELLARYAARTGRDVTRIEYYRAFAAWRLAVIGEGVWSRHHHAHPDDTAALRAGQAGVAKLVAFARDALDRLRA